LKTFECVCGNTLFFENTECVACERALGFLPSQNRIAALDPAGEERFRTLGIPETLWRKCQNYAAHSACNWMIPEAQAGDYCFACKFTAAIPDLAVAGNLEKWRQVEQAKRRLIYSLRQLKLPLLSKSEDAKGGLEFKFLADSPLNGGEHQHILTGHQNGTITVNIAEANDAEREAIRLAMHEPYRTLLGHLRHEAGHYYWDRLIRDTTQYTGFTKLFGDAAQDYDAALSAHRATGPRADWATNYVSAYASSHPWEDWAETCAHYLHIVDALDTARDFQIAGKSLRLPKAPRQTGKDFDELIRSWQNLTVVLNSLNRSLGLRDAYPFVLVESVVEKLRFVHEVFRGSVSQSQPGM
jgi:hypothetical protein